MRSQSELTLFRNAQDPLIISTVPNWVFPGRALTASTAKWFGDCAGYLEYARWVVAWTPGPAGNRIQLICADDGPTNIQDIADFSLTEDRYTPYVNSIDITQSLRALTVNKNLAHRVYTAAEETSVYLSYIELGWGE